MKVKWVIFVGLIMMLSAIVVTAAFAQGQFDLAQLRQATVKYQKVEAATAAGYTLVPGLDHCFNNPGTGAMGFHYINTNLLNTELNALEPEAMVYAPGPNGQLRLAAVEYIVPADAWAQTGNTAPPALEGRSLHLNEALGVYVLHIWVWKNNPTGMFEDWNPKVSCP